MRFLCSRAPLGCVAALVLASLLGPAALSRGAEKVLHYLRPGQPDAPALLAPPPLPGSAEQTADLAAVVSISRAWTSNDTAVAFGEKKFSLATFAPALGAAAESGRWPRTEAFLARVQADAALVTDAAKEHWQRPRPFTVDPSLAAGKLEKSFSYPSGHSTEGMVIALVLAELFPERSEAILAVGRGIGWHRVWIARHYPTDIYAGRVFAQAILRELKTNREFQRDFAVARTEIAAAGHAPTPGVAERAAAPH